MVTKLKIRHWDHDSIADDAKFEKKWDADDDYTIKHILIKRKDGESFTESEITIRIDGDPLTKDHAQCNTFGTDILNAFPIDEPLDKGKYFEYEGYNREGATISLVVELILEKRG